MLLQGGLLTADLRVLDRHGDAYDGYVQFPVVQSLHGPPPCDVPLPGCPDQPGRHTRTHLEDSITPQYACRDILVPVIVDGEMKVATATTVREQTRVAGEAVTTTHPPFDPGQKSFPHHLHTSSSAMMRTSPTPNRGCRKANQPAKN